MAITGTALTERIRASATIRKGQAIVLDTSSANSGVPLGTPGDTATENIVGVARGRISTGQSRRVATSGNVDVLVAAAETVAAGDPITESATLGRFGKAGDIVFGTYLGPKDSSGLAPAYLDDLASIGQGAGGGSGLPDEVYFDAYGNEVHGAANIATFQALTIGLTVGTTFIYNTYVGADVTFTPPPVHDGSFQFRINNCRFVGGFPGIPDVVNFSAAARGTFYRNNVQGGLTVTAPTAATLSVTRCTFNGLGTISAPTQNVSLSSSDFIGGTYAIASDAKRMTITNSQFQGTLSIVASASGGDSHSDFTNVNIRAANVNISGGLAGTTSFVGNVYTQTPNGTISGCTINTGNFNFANAGFAATGMTIARATGNITLSGANTNTYMGYGQDTLVD